MRMIEMMVELIAAILGLIKKGELQQAAQSIENAYTDILKQDALFFHKIPKERLTDQLVSEHNYTYGHLEILAELFYAEAELLYAKGKQSDSLEFYEKSIILFEYVIKKNKSYSLVQQSKITSIQKRIDELGIIDF